jgi:hypothetical protein
MRIMRNALMYSIVQKQDTQLLVQHKEKGYLLTCYKNAIHDEVEFCIRFISSS